MPTYLPVTCSDPTHLQGQDLHQDLHLVREARSQSLWY